MTNDVAAPAMTVVGGIYHFEWALGITCDLERFSEHRDELTAEVTIHSSRPPRPGLIHSARLNLMSTQTRQRLEASCIKRDPEVDWQAILEQLCLLAVERYRHGDPALDMREYVSPMTEPWVVEPFIERAGATILFGDGGTGKSVTALAIGLSVACGFSVLGTLRADPGPIMYLDWETDAETFHNRLRAILNTAEVTVPVYYRRQVASLPEAAPGIQREIGQLGCKLAIVDSLGAARGGEPESADVTIKTFNAARSFGIPWLGVDHVSHQSRQNGSERPFGSTFTHNLARVTWSMEKAQREGDDTIVVAMTNRKRNNGRIVPRRGYKIQFENYATEDGGVSDRLRSVRFTPTDPNVVRESQGAADGVRQAIAEALRRNAPGLKPARLAEEIGQPGNEVRARLGEMARRGEVQKTPDGLYRIPYSVTADVG